MGDSETTKMARKENDDALMAGEVRTPLSFHALVSRLAAAGVSAEVRDSSHYEEGRYISVNVGAYFTLERIATGEYLAHADADAMEQLELAASQVSEALTDLGIRHRFELAYRHSELVHYRHHQWPQEADTSS